jgi:hypothetical protein
MENPNKERVKQDFTYGCHSDEKKSTAWGVESFFSLSRI